MAQLISLKPAELIAELRTPKSVWRRWVGDGLIKKDE